MIEYIRFDRPYPYLCLYFLFFKEDGWSLSFLSSLREECFEKSAS